MFRKKNPESNLPESLSALLTAVMNCTQAVEKSVELDGFPPFPKMEYDRIRTFRIPQESFSSDGQLMLALRVWKSDEKADALGGPYERNFLLGPIEYLVQKEFLSEIPLLLLSCVFLMVGIYHLHLYFRRRNLNEYLWFGLLSSFNAAFYTFLRSQWKFVLTDNFNLLKEL